MIAHYNTKSLIVGAPGLALQLCGGLLARTLIADPATADMAAAAALGVGTILLLIGLAFYAKAKGRHPAWCLMAFLSLIGFIVLALLQDKAPNGKPITA